MNEAYLRKSIITVDFLFLVSLKRTTDVMFGGKQVVVCGYGEVSKHLRLCKKPKDNLQNAKNDL